MHALVLTLATFVAAAAATDPSWLVVNVNGTAVWQVPGGAGSTWTPQITSPFRLSDASSISFVSRGGSAVSCFEDVRIVPLVAPPPLRSAYYVWSANLTFGGVSAMPAGTSEALASFTGVPYVEIMDQTPFYGGVTAPFTAVATTPMERMSIEAALTAASSSSSSSESASIWPAPNLGPALAGFFQSRSGFSGITFADISDMSETFSTSALSPPTMHPPRPPYPPLSNAPPVIWGSGNTLGCPLNPSRPGSIVAPFHGAVLDLQVYGYPLETACAISLANNSTQGCTAAPPSPPAPPPTPPSPPAPPPALSIAPSTPSLVPKRCGVFTYGNTVVGAGACVYTSGAMVSVTSVALGKNTFTGTGAPAGATMFGLARNSAVNITFTQSTGEAVDADPT